MTDFTFDETHTLTQTPAGSSHIDWLVRKARKNLLPTWVTTVPELRRHLEAEHAADVERAATPQQETWAAQQGEWLESVSDAVLAEGYSRELQRNRDRQMEFMRSTVQHPSQLGAAQHATPETFTLRPVVDQRAAGDEQGNTIPITFHG